MTPCKNRKWVGPRTQRISQRVPEFLKPHRLCIPSHMSTRAYVYLYMCTYVYVYIHIWSHSGGFEGTNPEMTLA